MARTERNARVRNLARPLQVIRRQGGGTAQPEVRADNRREMRQGGLRWIDIQRPVQADVDALGEAFEFHPLVLQDVLSRVQRPKLDDHKDYLFIVLHFPRFNKRERVALTSEVDFFLGPDYVITVHNGELPPLLNFWAELEASEDARAQYMGGSAELLLYHVIDRLTNYLFPMMTRIDRNLEELNDRIFNGNARRAVRDLGDYRRDLIGLRRIIRPDMGVVSILDNGRASGLSPELQPYWSDISDHLTRVWDMLSEFNEEVEALDDTFNTLYSYRTNETLRALTLISVILLPLTLITGLFGMNVPLPFVGEGGNSLAAFLTILGVMGLVSVALLLFFRRKGWW